MKRVLATEVVVVTAAAVTLAATAVMAPSWAYATALTIQIVGPGRGVPALLYPPGRISVFESVFLALVAGFGIAVAVLFSAMQLGMRWERGNLILTTLGLVAAGSLMQVVAHHMHQPRRLHVPPQQAIGLAIGFALPIAVAFLFGQLFRP